MAIKNYITEDFALPLVTFTELSNLPAHTMENLARKYPLRADNNAGYWVMATIKALNEEKLRLETAFGLENGVNMSAEDMNLEHELKQERIQKERITNQTKLGLLIEKDEATTRVKNSLRAFMATAKLIIKSTPPKIIGMTDARDIEAVMTNLWNEAIRELEKKSQVIEWAVDGSSKLIHQRLDNLKKIEEEYGKI